MVQVLPPLVALLVIGVPVGRKVWETRKLERANRVLEHRIDEARNLPPRQTPPAEPAEPPLAGEDGIDWARVLKALRSQGPAGLPDAQALNTLTNHLRGLEEADWRAVLAELDALELEPRDREALDELVIDPLAASSPRLVFAAYAARLSDPDTGIRWRMSDTFDRWLADEPEAAVEWYRDALVAGTFDSKSLDGRNDARSTFDGILVRHWFQEGEAATAAEYLAELPEEDRFTVLMRHGRVIPTEHQRAFADLVRAQLPPESSSRVLAAELGGHGGRGGLERVAGAMDRIAATGAERAVIAAAAARSALRGDGTGGVIALDPLAATRSWLRRESPENADRITGEILGCPARDAREFAQRVRVLEGLLDRGAGQDMLLGFLNGGGSRHFPAGLGRLLERVADASERERLGEQLGIGTTAEVER